MGRGERAGSKNNSKGQVWKRNVKSEDSDEDYMLEEDELDDQSDELELLVGDASDEESLGSFINHDDEEEEEIASKGSQKRSMGRTKNGIKKSSKKRKRYEEDEDDDEDYQDDGSGDDEEDDYDSDDNTDDDEFNPDDLDFFYEEEELPSSKGKNKKNSRYSKKKGFVRSHKRKTGGERRKKPQKKKRKGSSKNRKSKTKVPSSRGKRKRMPICGKKAMPSSDSEFVGSASTEHEFTISEEEREQVREATEFCRRSAPNLRSSKTDQEDAVCNQLTNLPRRKGKEKVGEIKGGVTKQDCGICLTEEGKNTVRGTLNSCNHFFCFACIIEWSKVESRCPLCKQRFFTISKPSRSATRVDLRDVVIHIPERDQVYQPSEEELRDYLDPYETVLCTECHESGDDALMLLCDVCDSPAHTYCVGLGREVPEGNWYCEGCRPSALGFTSSHVQDHIPAQRTNNSASNEPSTFENMAEIDLNITIPETPMTPVNGFLVSPRPPTGGGLQAPPPVSGVGVSTLSGRRRVHRLQYLMSGNRLGPMGTRVDGTTFERRGNFFGSWGNRAAQSSSLGTTDVGTLYHAEYMDRLQENPFGPPTNTEYFHGRQNLARGQVLRVPSAADGTSYGCMQLGQVGGINLGPNSVPGCEWLQPCTNRLNLGSGTSMSPLYNADVDQTAARQLQ